MTRLYIEETVRGLDVGYFAPAGVWAALADVARVAANRSPAPCRIH